MPGRSACPTPAATRSRSSPSTRCSSWAARADQQAVVATLAAHLAPGGLAVSTSGCPTPTTSARYDGRIMLEYPRRDPGDRPARREDRERHPRRGDGDGPPDDDLRGGRPGRAGRPLDPARRDAARRRGRAARVRRGRRPRRRIDRRRRTTSSRTARAPSGRSSSPPVRETARGDGARDRAPGPFPWSPVTIAGCGRGSGPAVALATLAPDGSE